MNGQGVRLVEQIAAHYGVSWESAVGLALDGGIDLAPGAGDAIPPRCDRCRQPMTFVAPSNRAPWWECERCQCQIRAGSPLDRLAELWAWRWLIEQRLRGIEQRLRTLERDAAEGW